MTYGYELDLLIDIIEDFGFEVYYVSDSDKYGKRIDVSMGGETSRWVEDQLEEALYEFTFQAVGSNEFTYEIYEALGAVNGYSVDIVSQQGWDNF